VCAAPEIDALTPAPGIDVFGIDALIPTRALEHARELGADAAAAADAS
jgi:hypothetical protein